MKEEILRLLRKAEGYISGQELCRRFGVSRTAVWKVMDQLKKEGYEIEAVRNKGYRLSLCPDILSQAEIASQMETDWLGREIFYYDQTDSTNTRAKAFAENGGAAGALFVADQQVAGKGRRGRQWQSPPGSSISMSILLRPQIPPDKASMLTLVAAISVAQGIREASGLETGIKWPNDIVIGGRKCVGILTEMSTEIDFINYVVVGIGINVSQAEFPEEIRETATSLQLESGKPQRRAAIIAACMKALEENYETFLRSQDLSGLIEGYSELLVNRGRQVRILQPGNEFEAEAIGINEQGELLVRCQDGSVKEIYAGEVSVRGIYGYV